MVARSAARLAVISWDELAAEALVDGATGTVHSVFDRAFNLVCADGELVGVVPPSAGNGPATLLIAAPPSSPCGMLGVTPGARWRVGNRLLKIHATAIHLGLDGVELWIPRPAGPSPKADVLRTRLAHAVRVAAATGPSGGLAPLLDTIDQLMDATPGPNPDCIEPVDRVISRAAEAARSLVRAWRAGDATATEEAARALSGLGPGLTPSGDDLLAGFVIGVARVSGPSDRRLTQAVVSGTRDRTTDVAAARVRHAAAGRIEERVEDVVAALLGDGTDTDLEQVVERAARWGHTSGVDTLVGLLLGMRLALLE